MLIFKNNILSVKITVSIVLSVFIVSLLIGIIIVYNSTLVVTEYYESISTHIEGDLPEDLSLSDIKDNQDTLIRQLIILIIISIIFTIFISVSIADRISKPINQLSDQISHIGEGNYDYRLTLSYKRDNDEIGILIRNVEIMQQKLKESFNQINEYNKNLEGLVEERTSDLIDVNKELEASIANLKATQDQLVESQKMAAITHMVNGVAHKLNTPIGSAITLSTFMTRELNGLVKSKSISDENFATLMDIANNTINSLNNSKDILNKFHMISSHEFSTEQKTYDLSIYISELIDVIKYQTEYQRHDIKYDLEDRIIINSNQQVILQVLVSLFDNSLRHGFKDEVRGIITIKTYKSDNYAFIVYRDNGVGVADDKIGRIFDPFYSHSTDEYNIGLGLSIAYNQVQNTLHGSISCTKGIEDGIEFVIKIPLYIKE